MLLRCYAASVATKLLKLVDHEPVLRSGTCRIVQWSHPCGRALASQAVDESSASIFVVNVEGSRTISPVLLGRAFRKVLSAVLSTLACRALCTITQIGGQAAVAGVTLTA